MAVHRVFPAKGELYCQYEVFGAASEKKTPARVSASFELRAGVLQRQWNIARAVTRGYNDVLTVETIP